MEAFSIRWVNQNEMENLEKVQLPKIGHEARIEQGSGKDRLSWKKGKFQEKYKWNLCVNWT